MTAVDPNRRSSVTVEPRPGTSQPPPPPDTPDDGEIHDDPPNQGLGAAGRTFDSLRDPNFRWFFAAMFGHFTSMNVQMFIRGWLVFELTDSFAALGVMSLANGVSGLGLSLVGGVIADRVRQKKHVVQIGQFVNSLNALWVAALITAGMLQFEHLVAAALIQGGVNSLMMPARQAMIPDVVGMDRLMNALALNTSGMNTSRLLMPGLAGWAVGAIGGEGVSAAQYIYYAMAALYLWSVVLLFKVQVADRVGQKVAVRGIRPAINEVIDGFKYIARTPLIRMLLGYNFLIVLFSMTYFMLLPGFAKEVLDAGPERLGLLTSVSGVGALAGSLAIASLENRQRGKILILSSLLLGLALIAFAWSTSYVLSLGIIVVVGVGQAGRMSLSNVLIQAYVDDEYRGRVMSVYMMEFSIMSLGIFLIGILANVIGPQLAVGGSAVALVVLAVYLWTMVPNYRNLD
jgi:MFS family permease